MQVLPPAQADVERALVTADAAALSALLRDDPAWRPRLIDGLAPLLVLLPRSSGTPPQVRDCARLLLGAERPATTTPSTTRASSRTRPSRPSRSPYMSNGSTAAS